MRFRETQYIGWQNLKFSMEDINNNMVNVLLCVKAVSTRLVYPNEKREGSLILNPYDLLALEKLIKIKKKEDFTLTCICMGTLDAKVVLSRCIAMGADNAILLSDPNFAGADTYATTYTLYKAIEKINYDVIVCGNQTVDGETGQVAYGLAQRLGLPCVGDVLDIDDLSKKYIIVETKNIKYIEKVNIKLPAVISFQNFQVHRGNVSLLALKKAQKREIKVLKANDLSIDLNLCGQNGSKTCVVNSVFSLDKKDTCFLEGSMDKKLSFLIEKITFYSNN